MPLSTDWQRIYICEGTPHPSATAIIYSTSDLDFWADLLARYLAEGKTVAVLGENAQAVVDRYTRTL